jgi:hypothetical protein
MRTAYFDCQTGAAGNMVLASLIDAGADPGDIERSLKRLPLKGWKISLKKVRSHGLAGLHFEVVQGNQPERHLTDIVRIIKQGKLSPKVTEHAIAIFTLLAKAEAGVHGTSQEKIHFHEVGAVDAILDIVGICQALENLGIEKVLCSPFNTGHGRVKCDHGWLPVPTPATARLLKGVPVYQNEISGELVTPTGAAILKHFAESFGPMPLMTIVAVGNGAGTRELGVPNLMRVMIGSSGRNTPEQETAVLLETNIDDMNPQIYDHLMDMLFKQGALDVYLTSIQMKKNRPAVMLSVLCDSRSESLIMKTIFTETTTLGIRRLQIGRHCLQRRMVKVKTQYGMIPVKQAWLPDGSVKSSPEYEWCRKAAAKHKVPLRSVINAAMRLAGDK